MQPIAVIGAAGALGRRYQCILKYFDIPYIAFDVDDWQQVELYKGNLHSILITSPTKNHFENIEFCADLGVPILCEKPITLDPQELELIGLLDIELRMVNQYEWLYDPKKSGQSHYNYWNSGKDGQQWDCINIIGLSTRPALLQNTSPKWSCSINDKDLSIADMDKAYCDMINAWWKNPTGDFDYILKAHGRVWDGFYEKP